MRVGLTERQFEKKELVVNFKPAPSQKNVAHDVSRNSGVKDRLDCSQSDTPSKKKRLTQYVLFQKLRYNMLLSR